MRLLWGVASLKYSFFVFEQPSLVIEVFVWLLQFLFNISNFLIFFPQLKHLMIVVFVCFCFFISLMLLLIIIFLEKFAFRIFSSYFRYKDSWFYSYWRNSIIQKVFRFVFLGFQKNQLNVIDPDIQSYLETYSQLFSNRNNFNNLRYQWKYP